MSNIIWHIVKKDWRLLWRRLVLWWAWLAVIGAAPIAGFLLFLRVDETDLRGGSNYLFLGDFVFFFGGLFLLFLIVARLVAADSPTEERAHWRTLPLSPERLLTTKILFLFCFCFLPPLLVEGLTLTAYHFAGWATWAILGDYARVLALGLGAALLVAIYFKKPPLGLALFGGFLLAYFSVTGLVEVRGAGATLGSGVTLLLLVSVLSAATSLYRRRRRAGLLALAAGVGLACAWANWGAPVAVEASRSAAAIAGTPFPLTLKITGYDDVSHRGGTAFFVRGNLTGDFLRENPGTVYFAQKCDWTLVWPDRPSVSDTEWMVNGHEDSPPGERLATLSFFGLPFNFASAVRTYGAALVRSWRNPDHLYFAIFTPAVKKQLAQSPAELRGEITFVAGHFELIGRVPLHPGAVGHEGAYVLGVKTMTTNSANQVSVGLVELRPALRPEPPWRETVEFDLLVNVKRAEAVPGETNFGSSMENPFPVRLGAFELRRVSALFLFGQVGTEGYLPEKETPQWLADAEYVRVRFVPEGFRRGVFTTMAP